MVASHAVMEQGPRGVVYEMTASMASFAASGDWDRVEEIAVRLKYAVMAVPENERREVLLEAQRGMAEIEALAMEAKTDVTGKLAALRRGESAKKAYSAID